MSTARVTGPGVSDMRVLAAKLHGADKGLKSDLRKRMRAAAKPIVVKTQRSILSMPGVRQRGLREEIAATVSMTVSVTKTAVQVTIISSGKKMPDGKRALPRLTDQASGWMHPVFPKPGTPPSTWTWVRQHGKTGWFERPIAASGRDVRLACADAIGDTLKRLDVS